MRSLHNRINFGSALIAVKGETTNRLRSYYSSIFVRRVLLTFATRIAMLVVGLGVGVVTARWLGPEGRGIYAVLVVIVGMGEQFGNFGLHAANTYFIAKDRSLLGKVIGNTLWLSLLGGVVIALITFGILFFNQNLIVGIPIFLVAIVLLGIPFRLLSMLGQNILLGIQKVKSFNVFEFVRPMVGMLAIVVLLVLLRQGVSSLIILATVLAFLFSLVILRYLLSIERSKLTFDMGLFKQMIRYGLKAYLAALFGFLVIQFDMLMVNYFLGVDDAGVYSVAANGANILYLLPVSIGMILFPKVSGMKQGGWEFTKKVAYGTAGIMAAVCLVIALIARPFIPFFYGEPFAGAADALLWLLPGIFVLSVNTIFMNFFAARGMPVIVVVSPFVALTVNALLNLYFIPYFGINGASMTSSIAYSIMIIASLIYLKVNTDVRRQ